VVFTVIFKQYDYHNVNIINFLSVAVVLWSSDLCFKYLIDNFNTKGPMSNQFPLCMDSDEEYMYMNTDFIRTLV